MRKERSPSGGSDESRKQPKQSMNVPVVDINKRYNEIVTGNNWQNVSHDLKSLLRMRRGVSPSQMKYI